MAKTLWRDLVAWFRSLEGLDDPTGDIMTELEGRLRALENEVRSLRQDRLDHREADSRDEAA